MAANDVSFIARVNVFIFLASFTFLRKSSLVLDKYKGLKKHMLTGYLIKRKKENIEK